jgi:hypothetical protein
VLGTILMVVLILALIGAVPRWPHTSRPHLVFATMPDLEVSDPRHAS